MPIFAWGIPVGGTVLLVRAWQHGRIDFVGVLFFGVVHALLGRFIFVYFGRMVVVSIDSANLYLADSRGEVTVPLHEIQTVSINRWLRGTPITVNFKRETPMGTQVTFLPKAHWNFWQPNPVWLEVERLGH